MLSCIEFPNKNENDNLIILLLIFVTMALVLGIDNFWSLQVIRGKFVYALYSSYTTDMSI